MDTAIISAITSSVAAVAAIVAPVVTTVLNNRHQMKLKKYENTELHRREIIEGFLRTSEKLLFEQNSSAYEEYLLYRSRIFMYVDKDLWSELVDIIERIDLCCRSEAQIPANALQKTNDSVRSFCQKLAQKSVNAKW